MKFKKLISSVLALNFVFGFSVSAFGAESVGQPYESGVAGSSLFRIPSMITLANGNVLVSADVRYGNGSDSPANIDTGVRISEDNGGTWSEINMINHFEDFDDECSDEAIKASASFIDSAVLQASGGTVFVLCDACPAFIGLTEAKKNGGGFIDGKIALCDKTTETKAESVKLNKTAYPYYIDDFCGDYAPVKRFSDSTIYDGYYVDREYNLYKTNGGLLEKVLINAFDKDGQKTEQTVHANIFYALSPVKIYPAFYLWLRKSTDNGKTWSAPFILNPQINSSGFTGVCPGRGFSTSVYGNERLFFAIYDNNDLREKTSVIYSDDNGLTWQRSEKIDGRGFALKSSEAQAITLEDGTIRLFSRNEADYIGFSDSKDGGKTWSKYTLDGSLKYCSNCMVSFINYSKTINGKKAVIASFPEKAKRKCGKIKIGLVGDDNKIDWAYEYNVTESKENFTFVYSCLTELEDGSVALLYESKAAEITYKVFSVDELVSPETKVGRFEKFWQRIVTVIINPFHCF